MRYEIDAVADWEAATVQVWQTVHFRNDNGHALDRVVLNVEPDGFSLSRLTDGQGVPVAGYGMTDTSLVVPLAGELAPGCTASFALEFTLEVPQIQVGYRQGRLGYWGHTQRQLNLGMGFPLVAASDGAGWMTPAFHDVGEHYALRAADFAVELEVQNAPPSAKAVGPGRVTELGQHHWRFELAGAREIALSVATFNMLSATTEGGTQVEMYYFPNGSDAAPGPRHALRTAADALDLFERLYGAYPYSRLVIVQGDFPDGMEFSGLVFVSDDWFRAWSGAPNDWLTLITAHEVAHQWWYGKVGNDQGRYPYLDEALALYSELLFLEEHYPEHVQWWWNFRVGLYTPVGYVDAPVYDFDSPRAYINAIYLRGALMLHDLRLMLGDDVFFAWLRGYCGQMEGLVASPGDFWGALPSDVYHATAAIRAAYLRNADVVPLPLDETIP